MSTEIKIPKLGENIEGGTVTAVFVKAGDVVKAEQALFEMETGKATMEIPAPAAGTITAITVKTGDVCKIGQVVGTMGGDTPAAAPARPAAVAAAAATKPAPAPAAAPAPAPAPAAVDQDILIPNLGDGIKEATVQGLLVKAGDSVKAEQGLLEVETGKATVEIPSPSAGVVKTITAKPGDKVKPGDKIGVISAAAAASPAAATTAAPASAPVEKAAPPAASKPAPDTEGRDAAAPAPRIERPQHSPVPAAPSVRKFAREIGLDIREVPGNGPGGRISIDDVKAHQKRINTAGVPRAAGSAAAPAAPLPDFSRFGQVEREKMSTIRKMTVQHMASCWSTIPHVTQFDDADVTTLELVRKSLAAKAEEAGVKVTLTALLIKLLAKALKAHPKFNASIDVLREEVVLKKYCHIGVAVDTPKGLLVPVIRDADRKSLFEIARELGATADRMKKGKISPDDLAGGSMTITNIGGLGGKHFTPIVNAPEVAILGVGRATVQPVWTDGAFAPRSLLPVSLSYDHRLIDGADGTRFLRWVVEAVEQPIAHLLEESL
ncbi:MAG: 2-oxo acid dehydrogenase subunit E2 [Kiritimatiellia bacterium]